MGVNEQNSEALSIEDLEVLLNKEIPATDISKSTSTEQQNTNENTEDKYDKYLSEETLKARNKIDSGAPIISTTQTQEQNKQKQTKQPKQTKPKQEKPKSNLITRLKQNYQIFLLNLKNKNRIKQEKRKEQPEVKMEPLDKILHIGVLIVLIASSLIFLSSIVILANISHDIKELRNEDKSVIIETNTASKATEIKGSGKLICTNKKLQ